MIRDIHRDGPSGPPQDEGMYLFRRLSKRLILKSGEAASRRMSLSTASAK